MKREREEEREELGREGLSERQRLREMEGREGVVDEEGERGSERGIRETGTE